MIYTLVAIYTLICLILLFIAKSIYDFSLIFVFLLLIYTLIFRNIPYILLGFHISLIVVGCIFIGISIRGLLRGYACIDISTNSFVAMISKRFQRERVGILCTNCFVGIEGVFAISLGVIGFLNPNTIFGLPI